MVLRDFPPRLPFRKLPAIEQEGAHLIWRLLADLETRCHEFEMAVLLFERYKLHPKRDLTRDKTRKSIAWAFIAARDAASTVYKFYESLEFIGHNFNECPTLRAMVDHKARKSATKKFKEYFPGYAGIRHSAHHYAKLYGSRRGIAENIAGNVLVVGVLMGDTLQSTFLKKTVELDVTMASVSKLREVRDLYWSAFEPLDPGRKAQIQLMERIDRDIAKRKRAIKRNNARRTKGARD
jgi:hypothetical protein